MRAAPPLARGGAFLMQWLAAAGLASATGASTPPLQQACLAIGWGLAVAFAR